MIGSIASTVRGTTMKVLFLDEHGEEHLTTVHTTVSEEFYLRQGDKIRAGMELYHRSLGNTLISCVVLLESSDIVHDSPPAPPPRRTDHLRLVRDKDASTGYGWPP